MNCEEKTIGIMTEDFTYKAPRFFDFSQNDDELNDSYFDRHADDNGVTKPAAPLKLYEDITESDRDSDCYYSPIETGFSNSAIHLKGLRRSLSVGNLVIDDPPEEPRPSNNSEDLTVENSDSPRNSDPPRKSGPPRAASMHCLTLKVSQEHINRLAQPKRIKSHDNLTLAEAVVKFQAGTPKRFRSKPSPKMSAPPLPWCATKPQAPHFATDVRVRPVSALSAEEREKKEMEEAKKFKIKANPLNKKALKGPLKPPAVEKKPATTIRPFHLTDVKVAKKVEEPPKVPQFKAQPLPSSFQKPFKIEAKGQPATKGHSPNFSKRLTKHTPKKDDKPKPTCRFSPQPFKPTPTLPVPFSFEQRHLGAVKRKEQFIKKVLEEEKKAREFHANPLPKSILRSRTNSQDHLSEASSTKSTKKSTEDLPAATFKARPASVLKMKPFEPKKDENHIVEIAEFELKSEERVKARHQFEQKLLQKEMAKEEQKKARERELKKQEEEEILSLRKAMEHKAQPVKKYKELQIQLAHKVTTPISPHFHTDKIRNKENIL